LLVVKDIFAKPDIEPTDTGPIEGIIKFRIVNIGASEAKIISVQWDVGWVPSHNLPRIDTFDSGAVYEGVRIAGGGALPGFAKYAFEKNSVESAYRSQHDNPNHIQIAGIYFRGIIIYEDGSKVRRRTGFCRRYRFEPNMFIKVSNEDYEYQD
jgi:hypothetical protein